ncbi:unnamed protein product (mitochondrion) [Plasmodiophora brassicae]|uniref:Uncharacterized protein n=1 Tax=Plasmodiophora brassicae TaxID=37360 RepID=A0A0G4IYP5_PLABS|nr:hypothetical protein PBRA_007870 [Plasmodiophora brassicae]SPQ98945.1 unnamed protein product [Plasmodiophora brassicae]
MASTRLPSPVALVLVAALLASPATGGDAIRRMVDVLRSGLPTRDQAYWPSWAFPPARWARDAGIYESFVHFNFRGGPAQAAARNLLAIPDSNAFTTLFVAQLLAESVEFDDGEGASNFLQIDATIKDSVVALMRYKDKNTKTPWTSRISFWRQTPNPSNSTTFSSRPPNLSVPLGSLDNAIVHVDAFLKMAGLDHTATGEMSEVLQMIMTVFGIPPDFDDTAAALGLGAILHRLRDRLPLSANAWESGIGDIGGTLRDFVRCAYSPFAADDDDGLNVIDPRTYFWMHPYVKALNGTSKRHQRPTRFITTWIQTLADVRRWAQFHVAMPFATNNVDVSVVADALFGIVSGLVDDPDRFAPFFDDDLQALVLDSSSLIAYVVNNDLVAKYGTVVLLYYPSWVTFYWFVSRTTNLLGSRRAQTAIARFPVLSGIAHDLTTAMSGPATDKFVKSAHVQKNVVTWSDFLGNADRNVFGIPVKRDEDRVFSTGLAVATLLNVYATARDGSSTTTLHWREDTPHIVRQLVQKAARWLQKVDKHSPLQNAFFSASVKGSTVPTDFPVNFLRLLNGTDVACTPLAVTLADAASISIGVRGIMPDDAFREQVAHPCATPSSSTPAQRSFQMNDSAFPYWSSRALTAAIVINVLTKVSALSS